MTLTTESKETKKSIKFKKPNLFKAFSMFKVPETDRSFFVFETYDSGIRKETSDFIEKHKKAFESLAKK